MKFAAFAALAGIAVAASWAVVDTGIHMTADDEFCSSCHSHAPIGSSYREDLHGGNNPTGWRATCSQCHIPHDNSLHYLWVKGIHGVVDPTMELLKDPLDIDWHAHRELRERYVYDSACLSCHKTLATTSLNNHKAFLPHRDYFADPSARKCVSCHKHVGHKDLGNHLKAMGWEIKQ
jgi:cytochrome c-type protein NapC